MKETLQMRDDGTRPTTTMGGTDAGALLGVHPSRGLGAVFDSLMGVGREMPDSDLLERGRMLEDVARRLLVRRGGYTVVREGLVLTDPALPYVHASVDGVVTHPNRGRALGIVEAKIMMPHVYVNAVTNGIHPHYMAQIQHYLWVTGARWGVFALLEPAHWQFHHFEVERDEAMIARLADAAEAFVRDHLVPQVRPGRRTHAAYPVPEGIGRRGEVRNDDWWLAQMAAFQTAKAELVLAESRMEALKEALKEKLEAEGVSGVVVPGMNAKVEWREATRRTFNREAFQTANPTIDLNPFYEGSVSRSFHVTVR